LTVDAQSFDDWTLAEGLKEALRREGYLMATPVQAAAWPLVMAGRDLLVQSRTGTGKTLAFGLPVLERVLRESRSAQTLIVLPTRELALQVGGVLQRLGRAHGIRVAVVYGGGSYREQIDALNGGAQVVVGTPGRLCDLQSRGVLSLGQCQILVLDEADEILDMGFAEELEQLLNALPKSRQTLLFSATLAPEIKALAQKSLKDPEVIEISSGLSVAPAIEHLAYEVFPETRVDALVNVLHLTQPELAIIFCHTKEETEKICDRLDGEGFRSAFLNGDLPQAARTRTLNAFRRRQIQLLVATDVAARGIDVKGITHVFNLGVPRQAEAYVHRVGRTGRAGASGQAITFVPPRDFRRFERMLQNAGLSLDFRQVPQSGDVRKRLREHYHETVTTQIQGVDDGVEALALRELAQELLHYIPALDLTVALMQRDPAIRALLSAGLDFQVPQKTVQKVKAAKSRKETPDLTERAHAPTRTASQSARSHQKNDSVGGDGTRIRIFTDTKTKLLPGRVVQLVCRSAGVKREMIGSIKVLSDGAVFDYLGSDAARVLASLNQCAIKGQPLRAALAKR
jgi:ATP-dependent RNA helicase DeaD